MSKKDLAIAYAVKRRAVQQKQPEAPTELELPDDFADDELWADIPDEEPAKETPEARVARIMQNFRLSNLGNKSDD